MGFVADTLMFTLQNDCRQAVNAPNICLYY